jgi:hypothetical protein
MIRTEVFIAKRVFFSNLVALQTARRVWSTTYMVKLKHSTEHLAHDLRRQLDAEGPSNSIPGQVAILVQVIIDNVDDS